MEEQAGAFGSYLDKDIIKQIEVRQAVQVRKSPRASGKEPFSNKDYQILYHNNPWVCLRSSVDAPQLGKWKPGIKNEISDTTARKYILCGGTLEYVGGGSDGLPKVRFAESSVISNGKGVPGYTQDEVTGYRPKPGITKVTVKTKDTFGCIFEAIVDFTVYSRDELELIDQIYFKPGMSALLEWGHTSYHDSTGERHTVSVSDLYPFDRFFSSVPFETIDEEVQCWRKSRNLNQDKVNESGFCGNYEVVFGYITNFSYSLNTNGSYSCTVKILSKGSILEGLQIPSRQGSACQVGPSEKKVKSQEGSTKTTFHQLFNYAKEQINSQKENYQFRQVDVECIWRDIGDGVTESYAFHGKNLIKKTFLGSDTKVPVVYLQLNTLLHIINKVIQSANLDYVMFKTYPFDADLHTGSPYVSFNEHFSLNPGVVILPTIASVTGADYRTIPATLDPDGNELTVNQVLDKTVVGLPADFLSGQHNIIEDLWVNVDFVLSILDRIIDEETQQYSVKTLVEDLLGGIQKAMGNVNSFGIQINEVSGEAVIVDRNCIGSETKDVLDQDPDIIVSGTRTTVTGLNITSEVSAEMANEMSVAATAPSDGITVANIDQVFWNEGCQDRHRQRKELESEVAKEASKQIKDKMFHRVSGSEGTSGLFYKSHEFLEQVYVLYQNFVDRKATEEAVSTEQTFSQYVESSFSNIQREGEDLFRMCVNRDTTKAAGQDGTETSSYFQAGIIPIKVGFTMKGIGRFLIGSTFKISEGLVPRKYKNWRNIITGVEHNIDKSGWKTTVTSMYYPVLVKVTKPETTKLEGVNTQSTSYSNIPEDGILPTGTPLEQPKGTVEKFFSHFWKNTRTQPSVCAMYVAMMAKSWATGTLHTTGGWGNAGYVTRDGTSLFAKKAVEAGWTLDSALSCKDVPKETVMVNLKKVVTPGDIVIYYWKNPAAGQQNGYTYYKDSHGGSQHVQMKIPNMYLELGKGGKADKKEYKPGAIVHVDSTWTTSTYNNYGCEFVYPGSQNNPNKWDLWVLHAPEINKRWKDIKA